MSEQPNEGPNTQRIELRAPGGPLLGVLLLNPLRLEVKRGKRIFVVDLGRTLLEGVAVVVVRSPSDGYLMQEWPLAAGSE